MYLYDLYLRQNGKAFYTEDGLGFDQADLTEWWADGYNRVGEGQAHAGGGRPGRPCPEGHRCRPG